MKVFLDQENMAGIGGVNRVIAGLYQYLPPLGVKIVNDLDKADIYHAHIAVYHGIPIDMPLVVSSHGMLWSQDGWELTGKRTNQLCMDAYMQADVVTAPSQFIADTIARNTLIKPLVVRHGIDSEEWPLGVSRGYVLWNKARLDPANNPDIVNQLAKKMTHVPFITTFGQENLNVKVIGPQPTEIMKQLVSEAEVYLSTLKESGGPCFGVLEAMSCGVPVLAWNNGGTAEAVIHLETGYLAEPGNLDDLVSGLYYCLKERQRLGANARQLVLEKYQWPQVITGYLTAYQQAIKAHTHTLPVSIIMPCYNLATFLPYSIESVQKQTLTDWELIVVDDASTDNSLEIAQRYAQDDPRIKVLHNAENQHVSESRNRGVTEAKGQYIIPLDADDRLAPNALELLSNKLNSDRSLYIASGKLYIVNETDLTQGYANNWPETGKPTMEHQIAGHNQLPYCSMYRKRLWDILGGYRRRIRNGVEDADFWTRALSFGFKAEVIDVITLYYTIRKNSLSSENKDGLSAWTRWFAWEEHPEMGPFGGREASQREVNPYDHFDVSVVIPVGPNHLPHLQSCIDSLWAQTGGIWEAIVINDTGISWFDDSGQPLNPYIKGMPFVRFLESNRQGVAAARNMGIRAARSDRIVFLDADDILQKDSIKVLLSAQNHAGGWIYGDWYSFDGSILKHNEAPDWDLAAFFNKSFAPITGIYWKRDLESVGGFDVHAPGWEDWDMQLSLVERGVCGTRVKYPLITYNMHFGMRREDNLSDHTNLLQFIAAKHNKMSMGGLMGCGTCGGKASVAVSNAQDSANKTATVNDMVFIKYDGPVVQERIFKSPTKPGTQYWVNNQQPFAVFASDAAHFLALKFFHRIVQPPKIVAETGDIVPLLSQASNRPAALRDASVAQLDVAPEVVGILSKTYTTIGQLRNVTDADLLKLKGIGPARVQAIQDAVNKFYAT